MKNTGLTILVLAALALPAAGQVTVSQTGRELDANYRIGSGGYNAPRGLTPLGGFSENLYVTGQVTGGRAFQGGVPYFASDQLRLTLPSQTIDLFNRDSTGLRRVLAGTALTPQPYYSPYSTVLGPAAIAAGQTAPGTNIPRTSTGALPPSLLDQLYTSAVSDYAPLMAPAQLQSIRVDQPPPAVAVLADLRPDLVGRPGVSGLFGVVSTAESEQLTARLRQEALADEGERFRVEGAAAGQPLGSFLGQPAPLPGEAQPGEAPSAEPLPTVQPTPNQDVFIDMLYNLSQRQAARTAGRRVTPEAPSAEPQGPLEEAQRPLRESEYARSVVEATREHIILHGLSGQSPDLFNRCMAVGDERMKEGKYYEAAMNYETARSLRRDNPLPPVGAGLAYLAAGEAATAAYFFTAAMATFPPMMEVRLDMERVGGREAISQRLEETRLRIVEPLRKDDSSLVFLMAYMSLQIGDHEQAAQWAMKLQTVAGDESIYKAFAQYVLTGLRPTEAGQ